VLVNRPQALAGAFLATAIIIGAAAGWGLRSWAGAARRPPNGDPDAVAYLTKQVGLSATQQDSVRSVLDRHRKEMDSIWRTTRPRVDSLRMRMQVEIEEQLTPTQQRRFRELVARHERQRRAADSSSQELWDSDHDGVFQGIDKCPDTPSGAPVDAAGCPARSNRVGVK
jgi:Spy/CpxP family protein refolding chaperone